jgi:hypothetical protein
VALVFAEWVGHRSVWQPSLEGFNVRQLEIVREWRDEGCAEGRLESLRSSLEKVLRKRYPPDVPSDVAEVIQQTTDPEMLSTWFDAALEAQSLDEFRTAMRSSPGETP